MLYAVNLILLINNLYSHFTAIFALEKYQQILPQDINIKMNENISLTWIISGKNIPNNLNMTVKMDEQDISGITRNYILNTSNYGLIVLANFTVNSTEVEIKTHQFTLCALTSGAKAENICVNSTKVQVFSNSSIIQGRGLLIVCA